MTTPKRIARQREYTAQWRERNRERTREYSKAYAAAHRNEVLARKARYRKENRDRINVESRRWRQDNPLANREKAARYAARRRAATANSVDYEAIVTRDGMLCYLCGQVIGTDLTFDHDVPLARGGAHDASNIHPAHARCNYSKRDRTAAEYVAADYLGR